jgi:hypothetical protein
MVKDIRVTNDYAKRLVDAVRAKRGLKNPTQTATQMLIERAQQLGVDIDAGADPSANGHVAGQHAPSAA